MSQPSPLSRAEILPRVKTIMRRDLKLGTDFPIADDMPFFGGEADIDSLDILLLLGSVEKEFGIKIPNEAVGRQVFESVSTLVGYIEEQIARGATAPVKVVDGKPVEDPLGRLPHGPEFRFVTRVVNIRPGESAEAVWSPVGTESFFAGHFPGRPIVPGVLLAESMAQVSGLAVAAEQAMEGKLVAVDVRFEQPVIPPAEIVIRSQLTRSVAGLSQFSVSAAVGANVVARGSVTLNLSPIETVPVGGK